jgi:hypothetical protein
MKLTLLARVPQPEAHDGATSPVHSKSSMSQSSTFYFGMNVYTDVIAVASVAQDHGTAVTRLGSGDIETVFTPHSRLPLEVRGRRDYPCRIIACLDMAPSPSRRITSQQRREGR